VIERSRPLLLGLFLLSGSAGLMHEIAWTRVLRHVLGGSSLALISVLVAFLGGLAIGAWWVERRIDRWRSPLAVFGGVEILIGVWTLLLPGLAEATWPLWRALYGDGPGTLFVAARFAGSLLLLAPAAIAMGASLPLLAAIVTRNRAAWVAGLYGCNALGAAAGALLAGFVLLPEFGLGVTVRIAAGINVAVGLAAIVLARGADAPVAESVGSDRPTEIRPGLLAAYAVAGASLLIHEVAWARVATLLLGSTVYAYGLLLAVIVGGLAVGGMLASRLVGTRSRASVSLALFQTLAAASGLVVIAVVPWLPPTITGWFAAGSDAGFGVTATVLAGLFFLPAVWMGTAYPLVCRLVLGDGSAAKPAARVQAVGNLGALAGVCLAGFLLLPALGLRGTLLVASAMNLLVAATIAWPSRATPRRRRFVAPALIAAWLVAAVAMPPWQASRLSFGPFVQARRQPLAVATSPEALRDIEAGQRVLYHRDGRESSMTVKESADGERSLWINGKPDASSSSDLETQRLLAHVPLILHGEARSALIVGLASGVTLGSAAAHPLERIVTVDISEQAVEIAGWFAEANGGVLSDERVQVIITDGRLHLTLAEERYDVIISEPSNPWPGRSWRLSRIRACGTRRVPTTCWSAPPTPEAWNSRGWTTHYATPASLRSSRRWASAVRRSSSPNGYSTANHWNASRAARRGTRTTTPCWNTGRPEGCWATRTRPVCCWRSSPSATLGRGSMEHRSRSRVSTAPGARRFAPTCCSPPAAAPARWTGCERPQRPMSRMPTWRGRSRQTRRTPTISRPQGGARRPWRATVCCLKSRPAAGPLSRAWPGWILEFIVATL